MMVALFVYAYASGVRSSRGIECHCRDDVAFRVNRANQAPDHATIARFRARHEDPISLLFGEMLELCARAGLVKVGVVAVDGTKIAAAATHHATRSYAQIAREILEEAARIDAADDELYGEARGDELPVSLRTSDDRQLRRHTGRGVGRRRRSAARIATRRSGALQHPRRGRSGRHPWSPQTFLRHPPRETAASGRLELAADASFVDGA